MNHKDQIGRIITFRDTPKRIISLVPSQTELLYDLGLEESIVGLTKFCVHPIHLKSLKTIVGGTKQINIDKLKALNPDIILCNKEENTKAIVEACELICATHVSDVYTITDCLELINQYGDIFNKTQEASSIARKLKTNLKDFQDYITDKPVLNVAYFIWRNPWMVAANNTFINYMLELNKFENIYKNKARYPEVSIDELEQYESLDLVLLSSEPYPFTAKHIQEITLKSSSVKSILVDGEYFSWYGSRLIQAFAYFKTLRSNL